MFNFCEFLENRLLHDVGLPPVDPSATSDEPTFHIDNSLDRPNQWVHDWTAFLADFADDGTQINQLWLIGNSMRAFYPEFNLYTQAWVGFELPQDCIRALDLQLNYVDFNHQLLHAQDNWSLISSFGWVATSLLDMSNQGNMADALSVGNLLTNFVLNVHEYASKQEQAIDLSDERLHHIVITALKGLGAAASLAGGLKLYDSNHHPFMHRYAAPILSGIGNALFLTCAARSNAS